MEQQQARDPGVNKEFNFKKPLNENKEKHENGFVISGAMIRSLLGGINLLALIAGFVWVIQTYDKLIFTIAAQTNQIDELKADVEKLDEEIDKLSRQVVEVQTELRLQKQHPR